MRIKVIIHEAEEGGYWAEVPSIPGCATQGETFEELLKNLYEAVEGCLSMKTDPTGAFDSVNSAGITAYCQGDGAGRRPVGLDIPNPLNRR